jgi:ABC-type transporter Mla maintaining outer membrane lipid asymmetry ATPase subunit MlaF
MLELTGLADFAESTPGALARVWRKRAGLARALILQPEVLLVDNPLSGLDARQSGWWLTFLGELSCGCEWTDGKAMTLAVTAEDFRPWRNTAHQFAVLKDNRFVVLGRAQLETASNELMKELSAIPQSV